jgi:hypothetical protein
MDGTNGSTTFTNSAAAGPTITANGNAQISTARSVFGGASALFDGTGDFLTVNTNAAMAIGTSVLTLEMRVYFPSAMSGANACLYEANSDGDAGARSAGFVFYKNTADKLQVFAAGVPYAQSTTTVPFDTWFAAAITRNASNDWNYYIHGTQDATTFSNATNFTRTSHLVGKFCDQAVGYMNGNIDELRLTKALRYTASYTPDTNPFISQ